MVLKLLCSKVRGTSAIGATQFTPTLLSRMSIWPCYFLTWSTAIPISERIEGESREEGDIVSFQPGVVQQGQGSLCHRCDVIHSSIFERIEGESREEGDIVSFQQGKKHIH
eukprot:Gb_35544 [translate_table: standard]